MKIGLGLDGRGGVTIETPLFDMPDHSDNFRRHIQDVEVDALSDGVLIAEIELSKTLVDDHDHRGVFIIRGREKAAAQERNLHRLQIIGLHGVKNRLLHVALAGWLRLALQPEWDFGIAGHGHGPHRERSRLNAWNRADLILHLPQGRSSSTRSGPGGRWQRYAEGKQLVGTKTRVDAPEFGKAAQHQSGAGQQYDRQSHFRSYERALGTMARAD